jgi:ATP-dependent RNA helicase SUPV3L1/SUV3
LPRDEIAEEVKSVSQEERAGLRKHGVRFGAFHVFVPVLLKPAATTLRLLLWALSLEKQGGFDRVRLPEPPGQGLTSVPFDRSTPRGFYRITGFRVCGPRAVRIDMLERLGDLIRDRVFWKPRFEGEVRPAGSVEGGGFTVVPDMMSLVGCSGEEFTAILRSLGFRMLRRPIRLASPHPEADTVAAPLNTTELPSVEQSAATPDPASLIIELPSTNDASLSVDTVIAGSAAPEQPGESDLPGMTADEVWWPKDTGPFRHQHQHGKHKPKRQRRKDQAVSKLDRPAGNRPEPRPNKPARVSKPAVNPDSPFAVLGSLRSRLAEKKNV